MVNIQLIREQIELSLPNLVIKYVVEAKMVEEKELICVIIKQFGKITMDNNFNIIIIYNNFNSIKFEYFKMFFEPRLNFDNASTYIYQDKICIFKRVSKDYSRNDFENSMQRADNFIKAVKTVLQFVELNNVNINQ